MIRKLPFVLLLMGLSACASKKQEMSQQQIEEAVIQYSFAYDFYKGGELIRALGAAKKSLELNPDAPKTLNLVGLIYFRQERFDQAEESFKRALVLNDSLPDVWNNLGTLYYATEDYEQAEAALVKALEFPLYLYPENIYNNLGLVYLKQKRFELAAQNFNQAIRLRSTYYLPYQNIGKLHLQTKDYGAARSAFEAAVKLCARCSEPRYYLGIVLLELEEEEKALLQFKRSAEIGPDSYFGKLSKGFLLEQPNKAEF